MTQRKPVAAIYVRISRDPEGREAGVERQEADCRVLAQSMGLTLHPRVFKDNDTGASSKSKKARPAYAALLDAVRAGEVQCILAYSNSRITRRPLEWEELIRLSESHGLQVHTVVSSSARFDTADGKMILRVLAANDAAEADRISERVTRAKRESLKRGAYRGGPRPFGYESDGVTIKDDEAAVMREAARRILAGESLRSVSADLTQKGWTGTRNKKSGLSTVQLRAILTRPRNAGLIEHEGEIVGRAEWPGILTEDEWHALRALLLDPSRRTNHGSSNVKHLGSGLFRCGECGDVVRSSATSRGYKVYRCRSGAHISRRQDPIDEYVRAVIAARLDRDKDAFPVDERRNDEGDTLRREAAALRARREQLANDYADGLLDGRQVKVAGERIDARLEEVAGHLARRAEASALAGVVATGEPGEAFLAAPVGTQRAIVGALADVTIHQAKKKGRPKGWTEGDYYMDLSTVQITWKGGDDV